MPKLSFKESIINMLGEFVALKRNPEFRLSPKSSQFIDESMKNEYERTKTDNIQSLQIMFDELEAQPKRCNSTNSGQYNSNKFNKSDRFNQFDHMDRRQSVPVNTKSLFGRFRSKKTKSPKTLYMSHRGSMSSQSDQSFKSMSRTSSTNTSNESLNSPYILTISQ